VGHPDEAFEVGPDLTLDLAGRLLAEEQRIQHAGVVDEEIDPAEFPPDLSLGRGDAPRVRDVEMEKEGLFRAQPAASGLGSLAARLGRENMSG